VSQTSPSLPQASSAVPGAQVPSGRQQPLAHAQAPSSPPAPDSEGLGVIQERLQPAITARVKAVT
jgi:hypothetical protein